MRTRAGPRHLLALGNLPERTDDPNFYAWRRADICRRRAALAGRPTDVPTGAHAAGCRRASGSTGPASRPLMWPCSFDFIVFTPSAIAEPHDAHAAGHRCPELFEEPGPGQCRRGRLAGFVCRSSGRHMQERAAGVSFIPYYVLCAGVSIGRTVTELLDTVAIVAMAAALSLHARLVRTG